MNLRDLQLEGIDLMPSLTRGETTERTLFWRVYRQPDLRQRAVRDGDYKFVEDGGLRFLFDVRADPAERTISPAAGPGACAGGASSWPHERRTWTRKEVRSEK